MAGGKISHLAAGRIYRTLSDMVARKRCKRIYYLVEGEEERISHFSTERRSRTIYHLVNIVGERISYLAAGRL